ncbi:hypothetical protein A6A27_25425 [Micromonospora sp. CB01531]|nr:hypothetical protein A6A27_25425 [Micromonospora sp. CB01531]
MRVEEIFAFDDYWNDSRFARKRPSFRGSLKMAYGDNIYHRDSNGIWQQADSRHSFADGTPNPGHIERDTKADRVLASRDFVYYGGSGPIIPQRFRIDYGIDLIHGAPSYRVNFPNIMRDDVINWIRDDLGMGLQADPYAWDHLRR